MGLLNDQKRFHKILYMNEILKTPAEALRLIESGNRVFVQGSACTPSFLIRELAKRKDELRDVELVFITLYGEVPLAAPEYAQSFHLNALFTSAPVREAINSGRGDFVPIFLSDIPDLFKREMPIDVALVQVSPPDLHGFCSLGASVDIARTAVNVAKKVIAQVNPNVPRTHGDSQIHLSRFSAMVETTEPLYEMRFSDEISDEELRIGEYIADLIPDGATLQLGIGAIPDAVCTCLTHHKNLGVHTEMFSDGLLPLFKKGVINNKFKKKHPNKTVTSFALGTRELYDFVHDNPSVFFLDIDYVNDTAIIRQNPKVMAVNSAIEVDITGQVCSDSIGTLQFSGIGGQMDFMRGAALSEGGKPIIALPSRTKKGVPRIVPFLRQGGGVVTTRGHVHYIVTEYGIAYLFGKNLRQRAKALIEIAHPDDREKLHQACFDRFKIFV